MGDILSSSTLVADFSLSIYMSAFATRDASAFAAGNAAALAPCSACFARFPPKPRTEASGTGRALGFGMAGLRRARGASRPRRVLKSSSRKRHEQEKRGDPERPRAHEQTQRVELPGAAVPCVCEAQSDKPNTAAAGGAMVDLPPDAPACVSESPEAPGDYCDDAVEHHGFEDWGANGDVYGYWAPSAEFHVSPGRLACRVVLVLLLWLWQLSRGHQELQQESFAAMAAGDLDWVNGTTSLDTMVWVKSARAGRALSMSGLPLAANTTVAQEPSDKSASPCASCFLLDFVATRGHLTVPMVSGSWRADALQHLQDLGAPAFFLEAVGLGSWRVDACTDADAVDHRELANSVLRCTADWLPGGGKKGQPKGNEAKELQQKELREKARRALAGLEEYASMRLAELQALAPYTPGVSVKWPGKT